MRISEVSGIRVQYLDPDGPLLATAADVSELVSNAWSERIGIIAVPLSRLDPVLLRADSGVPRALARQLLDFKVSLAVVGDLRASGFGDGLLTLVAGQPDAQNLIWLCADDAALTERIRSLESASAPRNRGDAGAK